jgi:thiamine biosynthesis protein ThiS
MMISLNGEQIDARGASTIEELVTRFGLSPQAVLIEHNGLALYRREWPDKSLSEGDRVEFIRVVAGG